MSDTGRNGASYGQLFTSYGEYIEVLSGVGRGFLLAVDSDHYCRFVISILLPEQENN